MENSQTERIPDKIGVQNISIKMLILALNLIALDFLMDISELRIVGLILSLIAITIGIGSMLSQKSRRSKIPIRFKGSKLDIFRIIYRYFIINRRYLLISVLGLMIPILIISQSMLLTSNFNQQAINDFLDETDNHGFSIQYEVSSNSEYIDMVNSLNIKIQDMLKNSVLNLDKSSSTVLTQNQLVSGPEINDSSGYRTIETIYASGTLWTDSHEEILKNLPTYNLSKIVTNDDVLLIFPSGQENVTDAVIDNKAKILLGDPFREPTDNSTFTHFNQTVDFTWLPTQADFDYIYQNGLTEEASFVFGSMIMPETTLWSIFDKQVAYYNEPENNMFGFKITAFVSADFDLQLPNIADIELEEIKSSLIKMTADLNSWLSNKFTQANNGRFNYFSVYSPLLFAIETYQNNRGETSSIIFLISGPLAFLGIIFVIFVLKLIEQRRKKVVATMKMRGVSDEQLKFVILSEMIIISISSIILGMLISIPWTIFSLNNSNIIDTSINNLPIPDIWFWRIPLFGIIFSVDINAISYQKILAAKIEDVDNLNEAKQPFWQKYYLDLVSFVISIGFWIYVPLMDLSDNSEIINNLGPIMLFVLIFSTPLIFSRYFSGIIGFGFPRLLNNRGGLFKVATKNLSKQRFSTSQLAGFLLLGIMLTSLSLIVPSTYVEYGQEKNQYDLGADIYVKGIDSSNYTRWKSFENITEIDAYSEIAKISTSEVIFEQANIGEPIIDDPIGGFTQLSFLGIRPENFTDAAYWKDSYNSDSLTSLISKIENNRSILIQQNSLNDLGLKIGDKYTYYAGFNNTTFQPISYTLAINGKFDLFPNLVLSPPSSEQFGINIPVLAHIELVKEIGSSGGNYEVGAYINVKDNENITEVSQKIDKLFGFNSSLTIINLSEIQNSFLKSVETQVIVTLLEGMQILTMLIVLIAIAYYSIVNLNQRKKEIGIYRSLGMMRGQITRVILYELLSIIVAGLLFGLLFGQFISDRFFDIVTSSTGRETIPPSNLYLPWDSLRNLFLVVISSSIMVAVVTTFLFTSTETGNILREE